MHDLIEVATLTGLIAEHDAQASKLREQRAEIALNLYKSGVIQNYKDLSDPMDMTSIGVYKALIKANGGPLTSE
jgi:hypothetical protein